MSANNKNYDLSGTKAETLAVLSSLGYSVPSVFFFTVEDWVSKETEILNSIISKFFGKKLAVRSSTKAEDTSDSSMAGAFHSLLNVTCTEEYVKKAINDVIDSFDEDLTNQVLIQPMVGNVSMSGVVMTQVLDDGSPYHVLNYDDKTGLTDTVTSGSTINKTVYVYNGVDEKDFDSPHLLAVLSLIRNLLLTFPNIPLDIEFAVDTKLKVHLLQVRKITTLKNWNAEVIDQVSNRMPLLKDYIEQIMRPRPHLFGKKTLLGFMPDWNPAEMIGVVPHPLALSLYRKLITESAWRKAREKMDYRKMPNVDLMVSLFGRVYIDVRNSINSFIPEGLDDNISEKITNAYLERLNNNPHLHDKIEFEVVHTAYDFDFDRNFKERYGSILTNEETLNYKALLRGLTKRAMEDKDDSNINIALRDIEHLKSLQRNLVFRSEQDSFSIADTINSLISECIEFGTIPFSILARHGFIAEGLLRSAVSNNALSEGRLLEFRKSVVTVSREISTDFVEVYNQKITRKDFLTKYGHLRPSSYDILSPNYENREDLFSGVPREIASDSNGFVLTESEKSALNILLGEHAFDGFEAQALLDYARKAIMGREYAKFIFTKHLSEILELTAKWGANENFSRQDMAMLSVDDVLETLFKPLTEDTKKYYQKKIKRAKTNYEVASSFKLSYLIRSRRDVHIVPMQRSTPNFIGNARIEAEIVFLTAQMDDVSLLRGKIVCIEGADPGYDWIFTRDIAGLITMYGGANSHMAIRSAEYGIPASIGCGEQTFNRVVACNRCLLDCQGKRLEPLTF